MSGALTSTDLIFSDLIHQADIGLIQTTDGPGYQITIGDGLHSIMDAGIMMIILDGCGYPVTNGLLPG